MKINKIQNILKNRQYKQEILLSAVDNQIEKQIKSRYLITKIEISSKIDASNLNIIKGQKNLLLRSLIKSKPKVVKEAESINFMFYVQNNKKIDILNEFISNIGLKEYKANERNNIHVLYENLLLNFRRLNFFKINLNSLTKIEFKILLENKHKIWLINEIYNHKR
jgi:hypothetical protein